LKTGLEILNKQFNEIKNYKDEKAEIEKKPADKGKQKEGTSDNKDDSASTSNSTEIQNSEVIPMYSLNKTEAIVMQIKEIVSRRLEDTSEQNMIHKITHLANQLATRIQESEKRTVSKIDTYDRKINDTINKDLIKNTSEIVLRDLVELNGAIKQLDTKVDKQIKLPNKDPYNKIEALLERFEKHESSIKATMREIKEDQSVTTVKENLNEQQQQFESGMMKSYHSLQENIKDNHDQLQKELIQQQEMQFKTLTDLLVKIKRS
jgi:hypothetical protein